METLGYIISICIIAGALSVGSHYLFSGSESTQDKINKGEF